jgi:hypothetical protein
MISKWHISTRVARGSFYSLTPEERKARREEEREEKRLRLDREKAEETARREHDARWERERPAREAATAAGMAEARRPRVEALQRPVGDAEVVRVLRLMGGNRIAAANRSPDDPGDWRWFALETPGGKEHKFPATEVDWSAADWRKFHELERLAAAQGVRILCSSQPSNFHL